MCYATPSKSFSSATVARCRGRKTQPHPKSKPAHQRPSSESQGRKNKRKSSKSSSASQLGPIFVSCGAMAVSRTHSKFYPPAPKQEKEERQYDKGEVTPNFGECCRPVWILSCNAREHRRRKSGRKASEDVKYTGYRRCIKDDS